MDVCRADLDDLLREWQDRALLSLLAYNRAATRCRTAHGVLGLATVVLTAGVATTIVVGLQDEVPMVVRVGIALVSFAATLVASVHAWAGLPERIEQYERAARRFGALRREVEAVRYLVAGMGQQEAVDAISALRLRLDAAAEGSPNAPGAVWQRTRRHIKGHYTRRERVWARLRGLPEPTRLGAPGSEGRR